MRNTSLNEIVALNGWEFDNPPTLASFEFERVDILFWNNFVALYWHWSLYIGTLYVILIFSLQHWMKTREPFDLKYALFFWNISLAIFSIFGFARVTPPLFYLLHRENGFYDSICVKKGLNLPNVLWGLLFVLSKVWELGDTVFIVLRKRPLIFLQWYHHLATLVVTCAVAPLMEPIGRWYGALNYAVHALMYPYFALKTICAYVPVQFARLITVLQFAQMIFGLFVNFTSFFLQGIGYPCARHRTSIIAFSVLYGSFAVLFGKLLFSSFVRSGERQKLRHLKEK